MRSYNTGLPICLTALALFVAGSCECLADPPDTSTTPQAPPIPTSPVPATSQTFGKYEIVSYGTFTLHANDLDETFKHTHFGTENWTLRLLALGRDHPTTIRPYLVLYPSAQAWQDPSQQVFNNDPSYFNLAYGVGVEQRPLSRFSFGDSWNWLKVIRLYSEYVGLSTLAGKGVSGVPLQDWSIGFDLWKEYGFVDPRHWQDRDSREANHDTLWGELYLGSSYHTTNFSRSGYDALRSGASLTAGGRLGATEVPIMPYSYLQLDSSSRYAGDYFNNRMLGGVGIRTERHLSANAKIICFVEYRGILAYLKDRPLFNTVPNSEWRGGLAYQVSRY